MVDHVGIIGGGIGSIATATYLADTGFDVTVFERNSQLGGRASVLERDGFRFDMGPSWYLMPDVFERYFDHFDRSPTEYYTLERLDPNYRAFFKDGDRIDVPANPGELAAVFESYESGAGSSLHEYLAQAEESYEVGMEHFVYTDRGRLRDYVDLTVARQARGLGLLRTMDTHVDRYFDESKLKQLVQYSLVFLGGAPNNTPALYNLMAHVDFNLGVYYPHGGIASVIDALVTVAEEKGVEFVTDTGVTAIEGSRGRFQLHNGKALVAEPDLVVSGADRAHTELELLDESRREYDESYWSKRTLAPSAFLLYLGIEGSLDDLEHHTLVLPTDWDPHFDQIFDDPHWPDNPAYYVCRPSATDDSVAPDGHEAIFILVPIAPGLEDDTETQAAFRDQLLADFEANTGIDLSGRIVLEERFSVTDFADRYNAHEGTALGLAHTLRQSGPLRPDHRAKHVDGLYHTGSYTRPGIGMPMCLISGEHTASAIIDDT